VACRYAKRCTKPIDVQRLHDTLTATLDTRRAAAAPARERDGISLRAAA
jgi:hypothetical protein